MKTTNCRHVVHLGNTILHNRATLLERTLNIEQSKNNLFGGKKKVFLFVHISIVFLFQFFSQPDLSDSSGRAESVVKLRKKDFVLNFV